MGLASITVDNGEGTDYGVAVDLDGSNRGWQYFKPAFGDHDTQTVVSLSSGLPVNIVAGAVSVDTTGLATEAKQDTAIAHLATIAGDTTAIEALLGGTLAVSNAGLTELAAAINSSRVDVNIAAQAVAVPVTDNSGTLTVDAPVGTPVFVRLSDGSAAITTLPVSLASVPSHAVTNAGTFAVQVDGAALTALQVIDNPVIVDDAAFTPAATSVMMAGFEFDDASPDSVNEGDGGAARMSANRNQYITIRDAAGNERGVNVNASNQMAVSVDNTVTVAAHAVTNAGTFVVQENGAALTALQLIDDTVYIDDADFADGTSKGLLVMGVAENTPTTVTDGDIGALAIDPTTRALKVAIVSGAGAGGTSAADDADFTDGTTPGTPIMGVYESTPSTVTDGDLGVAGLTQDRGLRVHVDNPSEIGVLNIDGTAFVANATDAVPILGVYESAPSALADGDLGVPGMTEDRELKVAITSGSASGTEYTEGDTDATITGQAILWEDAANTLATVSSATPLPIQAPSTLPVGGGAEVSEAYAGGVLEIGGIGKATALTAVSDGEAQYFWLTTGGALNVADGGGSLTVDGAVVVTNAGTFAVQDSTVATNTGGSATSLAIIDDWDESDRAKVNPIAGQAGVAAGAGAVSALTQRATLASDDPAVVALQIIDDWDETDRAKVNPIAGQAGVQGNSGVVTALTQRVVLATDVALPAGTNAIGKLAANSGVDIGDTDVTSVIPGTGATNLGKAEDAQHASGDVGVMMLGVRAATPTERSAGPSDADYEPFATNEVGAMWISEAAAARGGASVMNATSSDGGTALTSTAQAIKASAGCLYGWFISNPNDEACFVNFYNTASGSVTVGTTNPLFHFQIPAASAANVPAAGPGIDFGTAMSWSATKTAGSNTAPDVALDAVAFYK